MPTGVEDVLSASRWRLAGEVWLGGFVLVRRWRLLAGPRILAGVRIVTSSEPRHEAGGVVTRTHVIDGVVFTATGPKAAVERTVDRVVRALDWYDALANDVRRKRVEKGQQPSAQTDQARQELTS